MPDYCESCNLTDCDLFRLPNGKYVCRGCENEFINQEDDYSEDMRLFGGYANRKDI
jgi:hypothetical protein